MKTATLTQGQRLAELTDDFNQSEFVWVNNDEIREWFDEVPSPNNFVITRSRADQYEYLAPAPTTDELGEFLTLWESDFKSAQERFDKQQRVMQIAYNYLADPEGMAGDVIKILEER